MRFPWDRRSAEFVTGAGCGRAWPWPALLAVLLALPGTNCALAAEVEAPLAVDRCDLPDARLEAEGARIREITIDNLNIFDLDDPQEDKALFRLMNGLHARTRPWVIERQLLFEEGDLFDRRQLQETERILRATNYLYDARVVLSSCDEDGVQVLVRTRDVWTLQPGISVSRSGGESRVGLDIQEENFLGRGGSVRYARKIDEERRTTQIGYSDDNLAGRWIAIDATVADNSDGHEFDLALARPFYALDTRWALGGRVLDAKREDTVYSLGEDIGEFRQDIEHIDVYRGWSSGLSGGWVHRWFAGLVYDQRLFSKQEALPPGAPLPEDRRHVYPYLAYQFLEDRFRRAENLDQIYRTEDVSLGARVDLRLGLLSEALGSTRDGVIFSGGASRGYGDPARALWNFSVRISGRIEDGDLRNAVSGGAARWYLRQSERRLLFASLSAEITSALDLDNPLEIGGDSGIRGYPLRYQRGDGRARFTIEQRYFTDYYLWRLFRVGGAVFFDAGRVWGDNPYGGANLGLLRDVGFGLRLASTRSSIGKMIHLDFAFPLDGDPSIKSFQVLLEGKRSF